MKIKEWLVAALLVAFIGIGAGVSAIIGSAKDYIEEEETLGSLTFTQLTNNLYSLVGDVGEGDCERIVPQLPTNRPFTVILESPGGSLRDGICLASHLKLRDVITVIRNTPVLNEEGEYLYRPGMLTADFDDKGPHHEGSPGPVICASSCSLMFLGGDERYLIGEVHLGIHAPRAVGFEGPSNVIEAAAYATASSILQFLEYNLEITSAELRRLFITVPSNSMYWVDPRDFRSAPFLLELATHYLDFKGMTAINPYASILSELKGARNGM